MNFNEEKILEYIGGKDNVTYVSHCMTRLRFNLKDESKVQVDKIKDLKGILGCQFSGGQFQIVIGAGVEKAYNKICELGGLEKNDSLSEKLVEKQKKDRTLKE